MTEVELVADGLPCRPRCGDDGYFGTGDCTCLEARLADAAALLRPGGPVDTLVAARTGAAR